ncbi:MAG: sigma 54-interacting transcriptional regulator [Desulfovibrionales bacterium]|nr:sigma 54-interacting transcriptional regulator [Desulfovibrionales bacterium]
MFQQRTTTGALLVDSTHRIIACNELARGLCNSDPLGCTIEEAICRSEVTLQIEEVELASTGTTHQNCTLYLVTSAIETERSFYRKILDYSHDEIFVTDGKGVSLYCNKAFERNYGMKREEVLGRKSSFITDIGFSGESPIPKVIEFKQPVTVEQSTKMGKNLTITATPIFDDNGEVEMVVENCRDITELSSLMKNLRESEQLIREYQKELASIKGTIPDQPGGIIFHSAQLSSMMEFMQHISNVTSSVLLLGDSGTGKSLFARHIHDISTRSDNPFITVNCGALPEHLLESELFGYVPGAFTGALSSGKKGLAEIADGGTLFLDEIGELPLPLQSKLLEFLQEKQFTPVGSTKKKRVDVRIISATNQHLQELIRDKKFRQDLYYRLKVIEMEIPPLRERRTDIPALVYFFLNKFDAQYNLRHDISETCMEYLVNYDWPGNVRELRHVIEQLVVTVADRILMPSHLPREFHPSRSTGNTELFSQALSLKEQLELVERKIIMEAYSTYQSSYKVAQSLGISQSAATRKIRRYQQEEHGE